MPPRYSWKAFLRLGLVTIPVRAYNTLESGRGEIHFNQLHAQCNSRIRYQKVCPIHGEVPKEEIVSGYEYGKGQYVIVEPDELDKLRTEADKAINLQAFVAPDVVDPAYYDGRTYYLLPDADIGQKPYMVLHKALAERSRHGIGQAVLYGREQLILLRPADGLLVLEILNYPAQVRQPAEFRDELGETRVGKEELKLAEMLIDAATPEKFAIGQYQDAYQQKLKTLIEAKVEGRQVVAPPQEEKPHVINLMEALRASVANAKKGIPTNGKTRRKSSARAPRRRRIS